MFLGILKVLLTLVQSIHIIQILFLLLIATLIKLVILLIESLYLVISLYIIKSLFYKQSYKQSFIVKSIIESEYLTVSFCTQETIQFYHFFIEINYSFKESLLNIYINNNIVILITQNPIFLFKTKYINISVYYICNKVNKDYIYLIKVLGFYNLTNILTKPLLS